MACISIDPQQVPAFVKAINSMVETGEKFQLWIFSNNSEGSVTVEFDTVKAGITMREIKIDDEGRAYVKK